MYIRVFNWGLKPSSWTETMLVGICLHLTVFFMCCGVTSLPKENWRSVFGLTVGAAAEPRRKASGFSFWARQDWVCGSGGGHTVGLAISKCTFLSVWTMETWNNSSTSACTCAGFFLVRLITWCIVLLFSNVESSLETKGNIFYSLTKRKSSCVKDMSWILVYFTWKQIRAPGNEVFNIFYLCSQVKYLAVWSYKIIYDKKLKCFSQN